MMSGAGIGTVCLLPAIQALDLLELPHVGFSLSVAGHLYLWSFVIALMSSVVGAWAWNAASRRLPMVLSGQLGRAILKMRRQRSSPGLSFGYRIAASSKQDGVSITIAKKSWRPEPN